MVGCVRLTLWQRESAFVRTRFDAAVQLARHARIKLDSIAFGDKSVSL